MVQGSEPSEFGAASLRKQRALFRDDLEQAIATATTRLAKKRLSYDLALAPLDQRACQIQARNDELGLPSLSRLSS